MYPRLQIVNEIVRTFLYYSADIVLRVYMLSTPTLVRNNLRTADITLTDAILEQYIAHAQAKVEKDTRRTFTASDADYTLAEAATTDLACERALMAPPGQSGGINYSIDELKINRATQEELKQKNAKKFGKSGQDAIDSLVAEESDIPFTTDQVNL